MGFALSALGTFKGNKRRRFDPSKKEDLREFAYFRKNLKWEHGCPFFLEWPYADIVLMCMSKFTDHELSAL